MRSYMMLALLASGAPLSLSQCTDGSSPDASCFNALDLPDYIMHWWTANEASCRQQEFAACFYASATKYAPSDCSQINNDAACTQPTWSDFSGSDNGIQNFYVAWNIWSVDIQSVVRDISANLSIGILMDYSWTYTMQLVLLKNQLRLAFQPLSLS